jgi:membrane-associated protease RseP (regulator of RpoE activity)
MVWQIVGMLAVVTAIGVSIALHEVGHLVPAKKFGVRVSDYAVGFGPSLWSKRVGETLYAIRWIPVGGYIRMIGMYPPAQKPPGNGRLAQMAESARAEVLAEVLESDKGRTFYELPVRKRIVIMLGGPSMNLLLAFVFFAIALVGVGVNAPTLTVSSVSPCYVSEANPTGAKVGGVCKDGVSAATQAKLQPGDVITKINGESVKDWADLGAKLEAFGAGGSGTVTINRAGAEQTLSVDYQSLTLDRYDDAGNPTGETYQRAFLGIVSELDRERLGVATVGQLVWSMTLRSAESLSQFPSKVYELAKLMVNGGERDPRGPVSVVGATRIGGDIAASEWSNMDKVFSLLTLAGSLNLFLFLFNLLPLLPLDGGHVAGAIWEALRNLVRRVRGLAPGGPVDMARMLPLTYATSVVLIATGALVIWADIVKPISLG